ncbi:hypothetical protein Tco_0210008 [Tanacetum coccineum]
MNQYTSRIMQSDLDTLIEKYNIPLNLRPQLPPFDAIVSELLNDVIGSLVFLCQAAIPYAAPQRHADSLITDPKPLTNTYDTYEEEPRNYDKPTLERLPFYCTPPALVGTQIPNHTLEMLITIIPNAKVLAKAEASEKRRAYTFGATPSQSSKRRRSYAAYNASRSVQRSLFDQPTDEEYSNGESDEEDDVVDVDDGCVEIPLVTPIQFAIKFPFRENQRKEGFAPPAAKGLSDQGGRTKSIDRAPNAIPDQRVDPYVVGPSSVVPNTTSDDIEMEFFPFILGSYYVDYPERVLLVGHTILAAKIRYPDEVLWVEPLSDDHLTQKMSVLHCVMMSHGRELLAQFQGLMKAHDDYNLKSETKLKGLQHQLSFVSSLTSQVADLNKQVCTLKVIAKTFKAALVKANEIYKGRKKKRAKAHKSNQIFEARSFLGDIHAEIQAFNRSMDEKESEILHLKDKNEAFHRLHVNYNEEQLVEAMKKVSNFFSWGPRLEPERLAHSEPNLTLSRVVDVSPPSLKESTNTSASTSKELVSKDIPSSSKVDMAEQPSKEQTKEWINEMITRPNEEMAEAELNKTVEVIIQGVIVRYLEDHKNIFTSVYGAVQKLKTRP